MVMAVNILNISSAESYAVRHPVLREGKPLESCRFPDDDAETTVHFGIYVDDKLSGVASVFENSTPLLESENQLQLRGMAVLKEMQGLRLGEKILKHAEQFAKQKNADLMWFNARKIAFGFYQKCAYERVGELFEIEKVGTHSVMFKKL